MSKVFNDDFIKLNVSVLTVSDTRTDATGLELARGLIGHSERREEYVKEIQSMIRYNKLMQYDQP